jgi:hypothetical protein
MSSAHGMLSYLRTNGTVEERGGHVAAAQRVISPTSMRYIMPSVPVSLRIMRHARVVVSTRVIAHSGKARQNYVTWGDGFFCVFCHRRLVYEQEHRRRLSGGLSGGLSFCGGRCKSLATSRLLYTRKILIEAPFAVLARGLLALDEDAIRYKTTVLVNNNHLFLKVTTIRAGQRGLLAYDDWFFGVHLSWCEGQVGAMDV